MTTISTLAVTRTSDGKIKVNDATISVEFRDGIGFRVTGLGGWPAREILLRTIKALAASGCIIGNRKVDTGFRHGGGHETDILTELFDLPLAVAMMNELGFARFDTSPRTKYVGMLHPDGRIEVLGDAVYFACHDATFFSDLMCANTIFADCSVGPGHVYLATFRRTFNLNKDDGGGEVPNEVHGGSGQG